MFGLDLYGVGRPGCKGTGKIVSSSSHGQFREIVQERICRKRRGTQAVNMSEEECDRSSVMYWSEIGSDLIVLYINTL